MAGTVECGGCHKKFSTIRQAMDHQYEQHPAKSDSPAARKKVVTSTPAELRVDEINAELGDWDEALDALD